MGLKIHEKTDFPIVLVGTCVETPKTVADETASASSQTVANEAVSSSSASTAKVNEDLYRQFVATFDRGWDRRGPDPHHFRDQIDPEKLEVLLSSGANINIRDEDGKSLFQATTGADVVDALIKHGADVNAADNNGVTPLMYFAKERCFLDSFKDKVAQDNWINCRNPENVMDDDEDDVDESPNANKKVKYELYETCSALCAQLLIDAGADVNARDKYGNTPLMHIRDTFENQKREWDNDTAALLEVMIKAGADVNARNKHGLTPLMIANDVRTIQKLIDAGADVNARDDANRTPLLCQLHEGAVRALIEAGADVNVHDDDGWTPLHWINDLGAVRTLIEAGADVNARDDEGNTPLIENIDHDFIFNFDYADACKYHPVPDEKKEIIEITKCLLAAGADINAQNDLGKTALHYAEDYEVIDLLLKSGADVNIRDIEMSTPLAYQKDETARVMLLKAGGHL